MYEKFEIANTSIDPRHRLFIGQLIKQLGKKVSFFNILNLITFYFSVIWFSFLISAEPTYAEYK